MLKVFYVYLKKPLHWFKSKIVKVNAEKMFEAPDWISFKIGEHELARFYKSELIGWHQEYP